MQHETGRTGYDNGPEDSDNDFMCAVQLQRTRPTGSGAL